MLDGARQRKGVEAPTPGAPERKGHRAPEDRRMSGDTGRILQRTLLGEAVDQAQGAAVFVWNEERHYVAVNEAACTLTGLSRADLIGLTVGDLSAGLVEETVSEARRRPFRRGHSTFTRRDGEVVEIDWVTAHTRVAGLPYFVSICWPREGR